jgi:alpha-L-rhamnosidase
MLTRAFSLLLIPATCAQLLSDLRVNGVAAPLGVSASPPLRFSWRAATTQDSYRVTLRGPTGVVFDTGAKSGGSAFFEYNGTALSPDADFSWDVLLFLRGVGEVGATAAFSTAPAGAPLPGAWVGGFPLLRAPFFLSPARIVRARLHAAGVGCFHAWVNGVRVTDELSPGWGHAPSARSPFYSYDVAPLLSLGGESVLAFALGSCKFGMYGQYCGAGTPDACNAAWALLRVEQEGGNVTALSSSAAWFAGGSGPTVAQHLYAGETHDARLEQEGWSAPGFAPAAPWPPARAMNASALLLGPLVPAITPAAVAGEPLPLAGPPVPLTDRGTAALLYDFSFTAAALCTLDVAPLAPPAGAAFTLTFGEVRQGFPAPFQADTPMYRPFTSNCGCPSSAAAWPSPPCACNCAPQNQTYIAAAKTLHTYTPSFFYSAGRYVQLSVSNWPGAPALGTIPATTVTCRRLYSGGLDPPLLRTSFPSAPALEALQAMTVRTHLANYITVPSDCPHRERRGWTGDGRKLTCTPPHRHPNAP